MAKYVIWLIKTLRMWARGKQSKTFIFGTQVIRISRNRPQQTDKQSYSKLGHVSGECDSFIKIHFYHPKIRLTLSSTKMAPFLFRLRSLNLDDDQSIKHLLTQISNHTHHEKQGDITSPFPTFNGMDKYFIPHFSAHVITDPGGG